MMTGRLHIVNKWAGVNRIASLFIAVYLMLAIISLQDYIRFRSLNFILGLMALPFTIDPGVQSRAGKRFLGWGIALLVAGFLLPVSTFLYFALCFALFYTIENFYGRVNLLAVVTVGLMSPVFQYFINTFSFPIRLQLTEMAGQLFRFLGAEVVVQGNLIIHNGNEFSVDPGCMGLKMMETSLLLAVMVTGFYQRQSKRRVSAGKLLLFFPAIVVLNVISNLFRIILLVQFNILPGTFAHDLAGIACLLVYVFIPAVAFASFLCRRSTLPANNAMKVKPPAFKEVVLHLIIFCFLFLLSQRVAANETYKPIDTDRLRAGSGLAVSEYAPGIVKTGDDKALIYIKYIRGFFDTDHNPMICWKGSGYVFEHIRKEKAGAYEIYTGTLVQGTDKLYSAWWYSNGDAVRISQAGWRWDMINGANRYALVNVTCSTKEELELQIKKILEQHSLRSFLSNI